MTGDEQDGDSTLDTDGNDTPNYCATCETRLGRGTWHPTIGFTDSAGTYRIVRFCSTECRDTWQTIHDGPNGA